MQGGLTGPMWPYQRIGDWLYPSIYGVLRESMMIDQRIEIHPAPIFRRTPVLYKSFAGTHLPIQCCAQSKRCARWKPTEIVQWKLEHLNVGRGHPMGSAKMWSYAMQLDKWCKIPMVMGWFPDGVVSRLFVFKFHYNSDYFNWFSCLGWAVLVEYTWRIIPLVYICLFNWLTNQLPT